MAINRKFSTGSILRLAGSIASICLLIYVLQRQGWDELRTALHNVVWWYTLLAFGAICISRLATVGRWHMLLHALEVRVPIRQTLSLAFAGLFACNFLPTSVGGDVARLAGAVQFGYDATRSAASLIMDRVVSLIGFMFVMVFALPAFLTKAHIPFTHEPALLMLPLGFINLNERKKCGIISQIRRLTAKFISALVLGMKRPGHILSSFCFTLVHMFCLFSAVWLILTGMGEHLAIGTIAMLWSIVYLVTLIPISINGLGWQEVSVTYVFTHADKVFTHAGHVSLGAAVTVAALMRVFIMAASLPGAAFIPSIMTKAKQSTTEY